MKPANPGSLPAYRRRLGALLVLAYALRLWMVVGGGQRYWPDESRYESASTAAEDLGRDQWAAAFRELFGHADHVLFRPSSLPVALIEHALGGLHPVLVAAYFALFSVGVIYLITVVARRAGGSESEALWAGFLAASSNCLFFYARHFFPYDIALCEILAALALALGPYSARRSFAVGCLVGVGVLTYNGYWLLGGCVLCLHTLLGDGRGRSLSRGLLGGSALVLTLGVVLAFSRAVTPGLPSSYLAFSESVTQGDFHSGWRVIAGYLWHAERAMTLVWIVGLAFAAGAAPGGGRAPGLAWWLGGLAFVGAGLVFFSDVVPRFVVYGRLARELVPFFCLAAGMGISRFLAARRHWRRPWAAATAVGVGLIAACNFATPIRQVFPDEFITMAASVIARQEGDGYGYYQVLYAESLRGRRLAVDLPPHVELLRRPNPMQFRPYQYEGFSADERRQFNGHDIAMRLVKLTALRINSGSRWEGYPGPVHITVRFDPDSMDLPEPLVVTGSTRKGDIAYVRRVDADHVSFGLDHWGGAGVVSGAVKMDFNGAHDLVISMGSLLPAPGAACYEGDPELVALCRQMIVIMDSHVVLSSRADFHPSTPQTIYFGANVIGGSSTRVNFTGSVTGLLPAPVQDVVCAVPLLAGPILARDRSVDWKGALGPLRLVFSMQAPGGGAPIGQPLVTVGGPHSQDSVFLIRDGADRVRVGFDRHGDGALMSAPARLSGSGLQEVDISLGSMLPPAGAPIYASSPGFERMRGMVYVRLNGKPVLAADRPFEPVEPRWIALGSNDRVSSASGPYFQGEILSMEAIGPENIPTLGSRLSALLDNPDESWGGYTGPIRLRVTLPEGREGQAEPLLTSGVSGKSDILYVRYGARDSVRIGFKHSQDPPIESVPVAVTAGTPQDIVLSLGALMPPSGSEAYKQAPELEALRTLVHAGVNGRPVLHLVQPSRPATLSQVTLGENEVGEPEIGRQFHGAIEALSVADPLEPLREGALSPSLARTGWDGFPGPLTLKVAFPAGRPGYGQPIVASGVAGAGDFILLRFGSDGMATIAFDHWGWALSESEPFKLDAGREHELTVSYGGLFPPRDAPVVLGHAELRAMRGRVLVLLDGRRILSLSRDSYPTSPGRIILGANYIGGSSSETLFTGEIRSVEQAPLSAATP